MNKDKLREKLLVAKGQYVDKNADRLVKIKPIWDKVQSAVPKVEALEPYIEFCTNNDLWWYGRVSVSSAPLSGEVGRRIHYLVRDKKTGFILGVVGLASDLTIPIRDKYIGWTNDNKWKGKRMNYLMNVQHCVATPELSNYLTGKLCALSVLSSEVQGYFEQKYSHPLAMMTVTSLFGKSSMYNRLEGFEYLGTTKGYSSILIPLEVKQQMRDDYKREKGKYSEIYYNEDGTIKEKYGVVKCYSDDTEVLTEDGWKLFKDTTKEDFVATINLSSDTLEYQQPISLFKYDYNGEMIEINAPRINLLVTPNHNLLTQHHHAFYYGKKNLELVEASNLSLEHTYVMSRSVSNWVGEEKEFFVLPELTRLNKMGSSTKPTKKLKMDDWLEFFGWYISEGCPRPDGYGVLISQKDEDAKNKIIFSIERLGFKWWNGKGKKCIGVNSKQLCSYLKQFGKSEDKFIPKELKSLSKRQLSILWNSLCGGDGEKRWGTFQSYASSSIKLAEDVQEIAIKLGMATTNQTVDTYRLPSHRVGFSHHYKNCKVFPNHRKVVQYSGNVYCIEVPNHVILVRRKDKICWCGNSFQKLSKYGKVQSVENFRGVYVIPLSFNYKEFLREETDKLDSYDYKTFEELFIYWKDRWMLPRYQRIVNGEI